VEAVNAFRDFVEALDAANRIGVKIKPILKDLLRHFFQMANTVEAMDVLEAVDTIVQRLGDDIQPFAIDCCQEVRSARLIADAIICTSCTALRAPATPALPGSCWHKCV
jgi:hypothetical protein